MCTSTLSSTSSLNGVGGQCHAAASLYPKKQTRYPLYMRVGGLQNRSGNSRPQQFSIPGWAPRPVSTGPETPALTSFRFPGGLQDRSPLVRKLPPSPVFDSRVGSKTGLHWSGNSRPHQFSIPGPSGP